jgi:hypothetical protein
MDEGRKLVLAIVAGILVARHLKTPEDLGDSRPSPRTEYLISSAVQWADRIMNRIDGVFGNSSGDGIFRAVSRQRPSVHPESQTVACERCE